MKSRGDKELRVFLVYMNPFYDQNSAKGLDILKGKLIKWCRENNIRRVAMLWVPSPLDRETCGRYNINPQAKNTVFLYRKRKIQAKWVNIEYNEQVLNQILRQLEKV